ncbi:zinc-binding dehydrogenase [Bacteroidota bacterium]
MQKLWEAIIALYQLIWKIKHKTLKATILKKTGLIECLHKNLIVDDLPEPEIDDNEVLVRIHYAALNHRDLWIAKGLYAGIKLPVVLGSDGAGTIHKLGNNVNSFNVSDEVIINPSLDWGDNESFQSEVYRILGMPDNGTLSEFIKIDKKYVYKKPAHLELIQAAAIPLAGLTASRALFSKAKIKKEDNVLITGIGGGVSTLAMLFAIKFGANVFVTSGSEEKINKAVNFGALTGVNYKNDNWHKDIMKLSGNKINIIIDSAGGDTISKSLDIINYGGKIVTFGATTGNVKDFDIRKIFWKQIALLGSTMGSDSDFKSMINFINKNKIYPVIDKVFSADDVVQAFVRMNSGKQFGKIVIKF